MLLKWIQRILTVILMLPVCTICGFVTVPFVMPEVIGPTANILTQYQNTQHLYTGYRIYGSNEWQTKSYIYWTESPIEAVEKHYEKFFGAFEEQTIPYQNSNPAIKYLRTPLGHCPLNICLWVILVSADQDKRSSALVHSYDDDPYSIVDSAPQYGTIIVFSHEIFSP